MRRADIVACATMSTQPVIHGNWLRPGQHLNLIGTYRPAMREADTAALKRARIFVDNFDTTNDHIGELKIPISAGVLSEDDLIADYYSLSQLTRHDTTLFKNNGGAHPDLMTNRYILDKWQGSQ